MRISLAVSGIGAVALMMAGISGARAEADHAFPAAAKAGAHWDMLNSYCVDCHNFEDWAGGVAFDTMQAENVPHEAALWEETIKKLRGRLMPPPGEERPDTAEIDAFVTWMENYLDQAAAADPDPGYVPLHRLNRKEYAHAVRDLLGISIEPATLLPEDSVSDGFDNVASALQVSPSFMEQYVSAARVVVEKAIGNPDAKPASTSYRASGGQRDHVEGLPLGTRGGLAVSHRFPADGEYEINIADMAQALWVYNMEFENHLIVTLDGKRIYETSIGGESDMRAIDQDQDPAVDAINKRLKNIRFTTTAGEHQIAVTFLQRTLAESDDRLRPQSVGGGQDRVLGVSSFEITGPYNPTGVSMTESREKIFTCYPEETSAERACAEEIIADFAERAYRRPVNDSDMQTLTAFYEQGRAENGFERGIRRALTRVLASPFFLYRAEPVPEAVAAGEAYELGDLALASRLSFFLWSTVPDAELRELAENGRLSDPDVMEAQVERMLADPRARSLASNFAYQWLHLDKLEEVNPNSEIFPHASGPGDPRENFLTEITLFVDSVFRGGGSVLELLNADYTFLNESLALHYDIHDVKGDRFRRVSIEDHPERWGLLGKGAVLMVSSYPNRTAPVLRGAWILENITGTPPAAPPPNVENLKENEEGSKKILTVRQRLELHRADPSCNSCHGVLDPLGFALENFDATGRWRVKDRFSGTMVDASGVLPDGTKIEGPADLRAALAARPEQFVQTLTEKLMTYALGRTIEYYDMPTVRRIVRAVEAQDYTFASLVKEIVSSDEFRMKRVPAQDADIREAALQE